MKKKLLFSAGLVTILTACSHDEDMPSSKPDALTDTPITVTVGVNEPVSRAGYDASNLPTAFVMFIKQSADKGYSTDPAVNCNYNYGNVYMAFENDAWIPKNMGGIPLLWKNSNPGEEVIAYTLQGDAVPEFTADAPATGFRIEVLADQTTAENVQKSDWLYAKTRNVGPDERGAIRIPLEHQLSQLKVELRKGTEIAGDVTFESVTVDKCCRMWTTADLTDGPAYTESDAPQTGSVSMMQTDAADNLNWECVLIPQTIADLTVTIKASDGKYYVYNAGKELVFLKQSSHNLILTIGHDKVESGAMTADKWTDSGNSAGDVETE